MEISKITIQPNQANKKLCSEREKLSLPRRTGKPIHVAISELLPEYRTPDLTKSTPESEVEGLLLAYLPRKFAINYQRGQTIYDECRPSRYLYVIVRGRVQIEATSDEGNQTMVDILTRNDIFGESALLGAEYVPERARALDSVTLMSWSDEEIEEQIERRPQLGIALIGMLVSRQMGYKARIQCLASEMAPQRLVRSLLELAKHMGTPAEDGFVEIPALSHKLLAKYVGTTRERVSLQMSYLRHSGMLEYSRKGIRIRTERIHAHSA